jgi:hypothetical protein
MEPHTVKSVKLPNCYSKPHLPTFINDIVLLLFLLSLLLLLLLLLHSFYLRFLIGKGDVIYDMIYFLTAIG